MKTIQTKFRLFSVLLGALALGTLTVWAATVCVINQKGKQFSQTDVTVKVGDTLQFVNDDDVAHNVFCADPGLTVNKFAKPGDKTEIVTSQAGTYEVRCAIHPQMKITVHVTP